MRIMLDKLTPMMARPQTAVRATTASFPKNRTKSPTQLMAATRRALDSSMMKAWQFYTKASRLYFSYCSCEATMTLRKLKLITELAKNSDDK